MPSYHTIASLAITFSICSAIPLETGFTVKENAANPGILAIGPVALSKTFKKYGANLPSDVASAVAAATTGSVTANPTAYDSEYLVQVGIGTPYQFFMSSIDTGGTDFTVSAPKIGAAGTSATENVEIGPVMVKNQLVEFVNDPSGDSNVVGLSYLGKTFYTNAVAQGLPAVFTADLKKGKPGTWTFGVIDRTQYTGSITYVPVTTTNGFWEFTGDGYAVGGGAFVSLSIDAIVDSGTTLLFLPQSAVKAYYAKVPGAAYNSAQGGYTFPCSATLPNLTLGIGTYRAVVPGSYLNYAPVEGSTCFGGLQSDAGIGFSVYGLIFMKSQFVVFKGTGGTGTSIGFAVQAG